MGKKNSMNWYDDGTVARKRKKKKQKDSERGEVSLKIENLEQEPPEHEDEDGRETIT